MPEPAHTCPLCGATTESFHEDRRREFRLCPECSLIAVPPRHHLDAAAERREYDRHENDPSDAAYRRFLAPAAEAVRDRVPPPAEGLDFGCGPGPTLSVMLEEAGYGMAIYDKFFAPDPSPLERTYDFVTATEVLEHLADPAAALPRLLGYLRPGGWLVVMTKRVRAATSFDGWHYMRDPTHVAFYSETTFRWIARSYGVRLEIAGPDVVALGKPVTATTSPPRSPRT